LELGYKGRSREFNERWKCKSYTIGTLKNLSENIMIKCPGMALTLKILYNVKNTVKYYKTNILKEYYDYRN
jgi:hypothetical protein